MDVPITVEGAEEVARRSRGTPRIANRLLRRVRDYAQVKGTGEVNHEMAQRALDMLNVDKAGLDTLDRRYLSMLLERFDGGPAGVEALAAAMAEDSGTLEDVIEPYLIQQGYVMRTARGRIATNQSYLQFGMTPPEPKTNQRKRIFLPFLLTILFNSNKNCLINKLDTLYLLSLSLYLIDF